MNDSIEVGSRVAIEVAGGFAEAATHEVTGLQGRYLLICPISQLDKIVPGQYWVPVTRITADRVRVR